MARIIPDDDRLKRPEGRDPEDHKALLHDPYDMQTMEEFLEAVNGRTQYGLFALENMARNPWASAIISTRQNQAGEQAIPRTDPFSTGFYMALRETQRSPKDHEKKEAERLSRWVQTCGEYRDEAEQFTREGFESFIRKLVYDSMVFDAYTFEVCRDRRGKVASWLAVDAKTIWKCQPDNAYGDRALEKAAYLQRVQEQNKAYFAADELCYGIRRPRTDIKLNGYGYPELAELVTVMAGLLYGWTHNLNYFKQGGPRGVVALMGQMPEKQLRAFQRQMLFAAAGVKHAFRTAVVNPSGENADIKWVPFGESNREMQFSDWINACFRLACALWQIDPGEVGFYYSATDGGGKGVTFEANPESKLQAGRDKGLRPLLRNLAGNINKYLIWPTNPDFEIRFSSQDSMSDKERAELDASLNKTCTLDEVRALRDRPPMADGTGGFVDSPIWLQFRQYLDGNKQDDAGGADGADGATKPGANGMGADGWPAWMDGGKGGGPEGAPKGPQAGKDGTEQPQAAGGAAAPAGGGSAGDEGPNGTPPRTEPRLAKSLTGRDAPRTFTIEV